MTQESLDNLELKAGDAARLDTRLHPGVFTVKLPVEPLSEGPLNGLSISIKDNIDVRDIVTTAGAKAFLRNPPATADAPVVARLRAAGAHLFAKTNMTEFAYSTVGNNDHFGTPANPWSRDGEVRVPGGSSSGAAVAVALGIGDAAIGTDTAGSARVPAALCGVVGFKSRQSRIPIDGIVPLSSSYDSVGVLAQNVDLVTRVFAVLCDPQAGSPELDLKRQRTAPYRLLLPTNYVADARSGVEQEVQDAFEDSIAKLERAGIDISRAEVPLFEATLDMLSEGGLTAPEALAYHTRYLPTLEAEYDIFTLSRLEYGKRCSAERYAELIKRRRALIEASRSEFTGFDAVIHPTCGVIAPLLSSVRTAGDQAACNLKLLRNTCFANVLDLPSISLPCHREGEAPVGLSLTGTGSEEALLALSKQVEEILL
ncbi:amidase [bacterium M00.F.Ca.ET.194.01.1.1]|nr:amidase [bacterium M00.F.Ca.ET.194.01.1.1]TGS52324.1 amidase [bacterium M00.F.Ca.ET.179.01.1.1]TGV44185.1 amidase [bacterium M00.F.Ca.ET.168.01.1.1]